MKQGDYVITPRFGNVRIAEVFDNMKDAIEAGYTEATHYEGEYEILGKNIGINRMRFAGIKK